MSAEGIADAEILKSSSEVYAEIAGQVVGGGEESVPLRKLLLTLMALFFVCSLFQEKTTGYRILSQMHFAPLFY